MNKMNKKLKLICMGCGNRTTGKLPAWHNDTKCHGEYPPFNYVPFTPWLDKAIDSFINSFKKYE